MPSAISYVRFSTPKQALGDSLRRQLHRTKEYCDKHGLTLDETLRDEGLSAYKNEHVRYGALGRFLAAVEAGQVKRGTFLVLEHLDRFSRQEPRIALTMLLNLINSGISVVTLFNEQVYSDASQTIEHDLIGAILYMSEAHKAASRKADLLQQTWDGHRKELASGQRKVLTHMRPAWLDVGSDGNFVANRQGKATVRRIFELVAGGMSTYAVCQLLNNEAVPTLTGNKKNEAGESLGNGWNTARISEIIKSDAPLGFFQPHTRNGNKRVKEGEPIRGYYPAVVTQELADRARYQITTRTFGGEGSGRSGTMITNLFSGLAKCAACGATMHLYHRGQIGSRGRPRRFHGGYLRCSHSKRGMDCSNIGSIPYDKFEKFIIELIGGFSVPPSETGEQDQITQGLIERLAEVKADAVRTYDSVKSWMDVGPSPLVMSRIAELETEHSKLTAEIATLEASIATENGKTKPSDELAAVRLVLKDVQSDDPTVRLLARTRVASGMKRFIVHFLCFPNRWFIAEYDVGGVMCVIRCWMTPESEYEVYYTDWDFGQRKGKPLYTAPVEGWQNSTADFNPAVNPAAFAADPVT